MSTRPTAALPARAPRDRCGPQPSSARCVGPRHLPPQRPPPSPPTTGSCRPTRRTSRPTSTTAGSTRWSRSATAIIAVGKFTKVTVTGGATVTRNSIFAFNATTGAHRQHASCPTSAPRKSSTSSTPATGPSTSAASSARSTAPPRPRRSPGSTRPPAQSSRPSSPPTPTARSPTCSCPAASSTSAAPSPRSTRQPRTLLAALNPTTGADTGAMALTFADTWNGGTIGIKHFDISDDGSTLVAVGNFRTVNGQSRPQIMMADLSGATASAERLGDPALHHQLRERLRHLHARRRHRARAATYFVVVATGAQAGGVNSGTLCDTAVALGDRTDHRRPEPDLGRVQRRRHLHPGEDHRHRPSTSAATSAG